MALCPSGNRSRKSRSPISRNEGGIGHRDPHRRQPICHPALRRFGWLAMVTTAFASISISYATPSHTIGSLGIGLFAAGLCWLSRLLWYRETGPAVSSYPPAGGRGTRQLMTVMAKSAGVNVPRLAAVGAASSEISLISFRDSGVALPDVDPEGLADDQLVGAWSQVRLLHDQLHESWLASHVGGAYGPGRTSHNRSRSGLPGRR